MRNSLFLIILFPLISWGIVDTRSAGYSKAFVDFKSQGTGYPFEIKRTYNSRSLYNGLFGFGWCSNLETRLSVLPDNSLKVTECGGGMEVLYHPKGQVPDIASHVQHILTELKKRKIKISKEKLNALKKDLLRSQNLRSSFLEDLGIKGKVRSGGKYYAKGRVKEYIVVSGSGYVRHLPNGLKERFDRQGRLISSSGSKGRVEISWGNNKIQVMDERGRRLSFHLDKKSGKIEKALFQGKVVARYNYEGENLVKIKNSYNEEFSHRYDSLHNLRQTTYPDNSTEKLTYNVKKDWVVGFKDRRGCEESYGYGVNKKNSNHYWATVEKKCGTRIVNKSKYEFWHRTGPEGGRYLHRARAKTNGRLKTDVIYHPVFGTPVSFFKNGMRTKRSYYANGFLKEKDNRLQTVKYSKYHQKCRKPEWLKVAYKGPSADGKKIRVVRNENVQFVFNNKCLLTQVKKSDDEWIKVGRNSKGQIVSMEDQSRKKVTLAWHKVWNKPSVITREGMGSVRIQYDKNGNVSGFKGLAKGPTVIAQVTSVFNSFLSAVAPVAGEMAIL